MMYRWRSCGLAGAMISADEAREVPEAIGERTAPPADVFCYPLVETWRDRVWGMLADVLTDAVRDGFVRNPPDYVVSDDLAWLNDLVRVITGENVDLKELAAERLSTEWRAFRAAHATRTDDVRRFYDEGLRHLRAEEIERRARAILLDGSLPDASEELLLAAIEDVDARGPLGGREGRLYFCADERALVTRRGGSGHYLVYGSEYLYCLATRTVGTPRAKRVLKSIGRPTMLVCDIPMPMLRQRTLSEFAGRILEYLFCELVDGMESHALAEGSGSALSIVHDLPGRCVVGHYHPEAVHDPL